MCGRFTITKGLTHWAEYAGYAAPETEFGPRFNICPGQFAPVALLEDGKRIIKLMRWGLVPFWAKDEKIAYKTINARAETLWERASFKHAVKRRRCLILADGFYEWKKAEDGKLPYYIYMANRDMFAMAGLWEKWDNGDDSPLHTFTIVTTMPNELVSKVHNRMPVILSAQAQEAWLNPDTPQAELGQLLAFYPAGEMGIHPVDRAVNNPKNDNPNLVDHETAGNSGAD